MIIKTISPQADTDTPFSLDKYINIGLFHTPQRSCFEIKRKHSCQKRTRLEGVDKISLRVHEEMIRKDRFIKILISGALLSSTTQICFLWFLCH